MTEQEVGRWPCAKCGRELVAVAVLSPSYPGHGAFTGPCPWDCGAWINRGFTRVRPGQVHVYRAEDRDHHDVAVGA